jgi:Zn finger protein HypA/HybF involved in hydrogenase expression
MLNKTMAYSLVKCDCCEKWIIYKTVDGIPTQCPRCGVSATTSLTPQEKDRLHQMNNRSTFNIRF